MNSTTRHLLNGTAVTGRQESPAIWGDCPWTSLRDGSVNGVAFYDDFSDFPLIATQTTQINHGRYKLFSGSSGSIAPVDAVNSVQTPGNALAVTLNGDNTAGSIALSYSPFALTGLASNTGKLWFEACVGISTILTNTIGFFLGLGEADAFTLSATVPFNAASASISNSGSLIGFFKGEDELGAINTAYTDRATSFTNIGDDEASIAAYTFTRLGMVYDPGNGSACITFYQNNDKLTSVMTSTTLTGLTNLDANNVAPMLAVIGDSSASTGAVYLKWWKCAQLLP